MNWTGGRLSRHSRAVGLLNSQQKQHFAKVQSNVLNSLEKIPLKGSIFNKFEAHRAESHPRIPSSTEPRTAYIDAESQQIQRYNYSPRYTANSGPLISDTNFQRAHERQHTRLYSPSKEVVPKVETTPDDLYSTTPKPWETKRKPKIINPLSGKESDLAGEDESLLIKRRRLLQRGDWVGISFQQPLQMVFTSPTYDENVGKRRKLTTENWAKHSSKISSSMTSPFATITQPHSFHNSNRQRWKRARPRNYDVQISIDGDLVRKGCSSSTGLNRRRGCSTRRQQLEQPQTSSSDVMLLDNEEMPVRQSSGTARKYSSFDSLEIEAFEKTSKSGNKSKHPPNVYFEDSRNPGRYESVGDHDLSHHYPVGYCWSDDISSHDLRYQSSKEEDAVLGIHILKPSASPIVGTSCLPRRQGLAFSSYCTSMHHPVPKSSRTSLLLRSDSSIADSIVARVGKIRPMVATSQEVDNEIWETWIAPLYSEEQFLEDKEAAIDCRGSTSPAVGIYGVGHASHPLYSKYDAETPDLQTQQFAQADQVLRIPLASPQVASVSKHSPEVRKPVKGALRHDMSKSNVTEKRLDCLSRATFLENVSPTNLHLCTRHMEVGLDPFESHIDFVASVVQRERAIAKAQSPIKVTPQVDSDSLWRKFVFGSSSEEKDEIDYDISQPSPNLRVQRQEPIVSPIVSSSSTEISVCSTRHSGRRNPQTPNLPDSALQTSTSSIDSKSTRSSNDFASRHLNQLTKATASGYPSTRYGDKHASNGSPVSSSSDLALASVVAVIDSQSEMQKLEESPPLRRHQNKILFTKPKPFEDLKAKSGSYKTRDNSSHIGGGLMVDEEVVNLRKRERDVYSLVDSDELDSMDGD